MQRSTSILGFAFLSLTLASCYGPEDEPRPFAGPGRARSLDHGPRYGDNNRYFDPQAPQTRGIPGDLSVDPSTIPPNANTTPPPGIATGPVDPGLKPTPPGTDPNAPATAAAPPPATPPAAPATPPASDVPYARAVPGKPGYVYNPHDGKILDVTGMRPGTKVKDPSTGAMFRVP